MPRLARLTDVTVALVRHGAHDELGRILSGRTSHVGLNAAGRAQVARLGARLAANGHDFTRLECSPRRRTVETAQILGDALGLQPQVAPALDEVDFGRWSGRAFADLDGDPAWAHWNAERGRAGTPGGENMAAVVARVSGHLAALPGGPVLCVSHCDVIRAVLAHYLRLDLNHLLRFEVSPGSVSWLKVDGQFEGRVLTMNGEN